ncbi:MAG: hypothetical protein OEY14_15645, partial [Myxococcales bacterium]|nr:hypothetical protein [Myxococcales bacterium]
MAFLAAAARSLIWPAEPGASLSSLALRALILFALVLTLGSLAALLRGWLPALAPLRAARALDAALDLHEVVASGLAFEQEQASSPPPDSDSGSSIPPPDLERRLARMRAETALERLRLGESFPLPPIGPSARRGLVYGVGLVFSLALGVLDPALVAIVVDPPSGAEIDRAALLEAAADALARLEEPPDREARPGESPSPETRPSAERAAEARRRSLSQLAQAAAEASRRGDREQALARLQSLQREGRARSAEARRLDAGLRRLARALRSEGPRPPSASGASRSGSGASRGGEASSPSERMRLLSRRLRREAEGVAGEAERARTLERLSRAATEAASSPEGRRVAEALREASSALSRGALERAARALDEAARHAAELEETREASAALARAIERMLERAGALERAVMRAMLGRPEPGAEGGALAMGEPSAGEALGEGPEGDGEGMSALRRALAERLAAMGLGEGAPAPGGPGGLGPERGRAGAPLEASGALHLPSQIPEGERA